MDYQPIEVFYYSSSPIEFKDEHTIVRPSGGQSMQDFFNSAKSSKAPIVLFLTHGYSPCHDAILQSVFEYMSLMSLADIVTCDIKINGFDVIYPLTPKISIPLFIRTNRLLNMTEDNLFTYASKYKNKLNIPMVLFNYEDKQR